MLVDRFKSSVRLDDLISHTGVYVCLSVNKHGLSLCCTASVPPGHAKNSVHANFIKCPDLSLANN